MGIIISRKMLIILLLGMCIGWATEDRVQQPASYVLAKTFEDRVKEHDLLFAEVKRLESELNVIKNRLMMLEQK
jgi:hypothetical protein